MKILSITGAINGKNRGTPIRVYQIIQSIAHINEEGISVASEDTSLSLEKGEHFRIPAGVLPKIKYFISNRFFSEKKFDLVIFHTSGNSILLLLFKIFSKSKIMIEMHGFIKDEIFLQEKVRSPFRFVQIYFHDFMSILSFCFADFITTCSYSAKLRLLKYNKNIHVLWGGSNKIEDSVIESQELLQYLSNVKKENKLVLGYSGNSRPWQGLDFLLNFYIKYEKELNLALILVLSSKNDLSKILQCENVYLAENLSKNEADKIISEADVLVIPRPDNKVVRYSFASKLLTYFTLGKPILSSKIGDVDFHLLDYLTGFTYLPDNESDFKSKLLILNDDQLRDRISANMKVYSNLVLNWNVQIKDLFIFLKSK